MISYSLANRRGNMLWLLVVSSLLAGSIDGEIISVHDATPEKGLPQNLTFYVKSRQHNVKLFLQKNNQEYLPKQSLESQSYQDFLHDGSFDVSLTKQNTEQYVRTLTGNFKLNGELVQIKPMMDHFTQQTQANSWTPYILLTNEEMTLRNLPDLTKGDNLLVLYLLAQREEKLKRKRKSVNDFSTGSTAFPVTTPDSLTTEEQSLQTEMPDSSEITSSWSNDVPSTLSSDRTDMSSQSSYTFAKTTPGSVFSTKIYIRRNCRDRFSDCGKWLHDYYENNVHDFCGRDMYESWCCNTCDNWKAAPTQCMDILNDCQKRLKYKYNNDYDAFCPTLGKSCCVTCAGKPDEGCVDKGFLGLTCPRLLQWAVHGNMEEMCIYYKKECCVMCSGR